VDASVAILWDWSSWWAATTEAVPTSRLDPLATVRQWHRALWRRGVGVDVLTRLDDLDRYAVVLAPALTVLDPERAGRLTAYVEGGGSLVWGPFGGVCDELGHLWQGRAPALLRDLLGVSSEEWAPLPDAGCAVTGPDLPAGRASILGERTRSDGAEVLATYADGPLEGSVAAARHTHAAGRTLYVGATLDDDTLGLLLAGCLAAAGVPTSALPDGVELTVRGDAAVVVNHSGARVHLDLDGLAPEWVGGEHALSDLLGGPGPAGGRLDLAPYAAAVLVPEHPSPSVSAGVR
jgi:beta-galactosidase